MSQEEKHTTTWNGLLTFLRAGDTPATTGGWKKKKRQAQPAAGEKKQRPGAGAGGAAPALPPGLRVWVSAAAKTQRHSHKRVSRIVLPPLSAGSRPSAASFYHTVSLLCGRVCPGASPPSCQSSSLPGKRRARSTKGVRDAKKKKKKKRRVADASLFLPPVHRRRLPRCPSCCCPSPFLGLSPQKGSSGARPARTYASWDGRWGVTPEREEGQGGNMKRKKAL